MDATLIVVDPDIQSGTPVFAGTRVPIQNLFDYLEEGDSLEVFLEPFPAKDPSESWRLAPPRSA